MSIDLKNNPKNNSRLKEGLSFLKEHGKLIGILGSLLPLLILYMVRFIFSDIIDEPNIWMIFISASIGIVIVPLYFLVFGVGINYCLSNVYWLDRYLKVNTNVSRRAKNKIFQTVFVFFIPCMIVVISLVILSYINQSSEVFTIVFISMGTIFLLLYPMILNAIKLYGFSFTRNKKKRVTFLLLRKNWSLNFFRLLLSSLFALSVLSILVVSPKLRVPEMSFELMRSLLLASSCIFFAISLIVYTSSWKMVSVALLICFMVLTFEINLSELPIKKILADKNTAYIKNRVLVLERSPCEYLDRSGVNIKNISKTQCYIDEPFIIKSAVGDSYLLVINPDTIKEHEKRVPKSEVRYYDKHPSNRLKQHHLDSVVKAFSKLHKMDHLIVALQNNANKQIVVSPVVSAENTKVKLGKNSKGLLLGFFINNTSGLMDLDDKIEQYLDTDSRLSIKEEFANSGSKLSRQLFSHLQSLNTRLIDKVVSNYDEIELVKLIQLFSQLNENEKLVHDLLELGYLHQYKYKHEEYILSKNEFGEICVNLIYHKGYRIALSLITSCNQRVINQQSEISLLTRIENMRVK